MYNVHRKLLVFLLHVQLLRNLFGAIHKKRRLFSVKWEDEVLMYIVQVVTKHYGQVQINLVRPKSIWTDQNCFGHIEGQGIQLVSHAKEGSILQLKPGLL